MLGFYFYKVNAVWKFKTNWFKYYSSYECECGPFEYINLNQFLSDIAFASMLTRAYGSDFLRKIFLPVPPKLLVI